MTHQTKYKTVTEQVTRCCDGYVQVGQYCALREFALFIHLCVSGCNMWHCTSKVTYQCLVLHKIQQMEAQKLHYHKYVSVTIRPVTCYFLWKSYKQEYGVHCQTRIMSTWRWSEFQYWGVWVGHRLSRVAKMLPEIRDLLLHWSCKLVYILIILIGCRMHCVLLSIKPYVPLNMFRVVELFWEWRTAFQCNSDSEDRLPAPAVQRERASESHKTAASNGDAETHTKWKQE